MCAPALGRALAQLAGLYLHPQRGSAPDPVTAEGLLRAALDKLNGPYALRDDRHVRYLKSLSPCLIHFPHALDHIGGCRHLHERAALTHTYAGLLSKWDKREAAGSDTARNADMLVESLRADKDGCVCMFVCSLYFVLRNA